ncbi:hypothetical protein [Salibacterium halotolerans]|uniref:hypothetical protein n=1 Tax=Salibacterium halotolerans TaxID=1884432 RepID=UPI00147D447C|nr:hypothetical protein [Salibacterium halotolerans]
MNETNKRLHSLQTTVHPPCIVLYPYGRICFLFLRYTGWRRDHIAEQLSCGFDSGKRVLERPGSVGFNKQLIRQDRSREPWWLLRPAQDVHGFRKRSPLFLSRTSSFSSRAHGIEDTMSASESMPPLCSGVQRRHDERQ